MKIKIIIAAISIIKSFVNCQNTSPYTKLEWSDEFNQNQLNTDEWEQVTGFMGYNNELQTYTDSNTYVKDGKLNIVAKKESKDGAQYTSARLYGRKGFKYGRIESSIKLPKGAGLWPAFWLLPRDSPYGEWPACGEIDIVESTDNMDYITGTLHYGNEDKHDMTYNSIYNRDFSDDFHVFAVEWEENEIKWYVDDELYSTKTSESWWNNFANSAPMDTEFSIILNLAVGGDMTKAPVDDNMTSATMEVEYVRVYSKEASPDLAIEPVSEPSNRELYVPKPKITATKKNPSRFL